MTPEQVFVSVQDAAAHALERLVRGQQPRGGSQVVLGCSQGGARQWLKIQAEGVKKGAEEEDEGRDGDEMINLSRLSQKTLAEWLSWLERLPIYQ